ncbi:MAG: hypothetical protein WA460_09750 [Nitrososphaeraceae archaeon]
MIEPGTRNMPLPLQRTVGLGVGLAAPPNFCLMFSRVVINEKLWDLSVLKVDLSRSMKIKLAACLFIPLYSVKKG